MVNNALILTGKIISKLINTFNLGNGSTWPGHIALSVNKRFIKDLLVKSDTPVIFVVGTNGKTTTTSLIKHFIQANNKQVIQNTSGANLLNGIASTLLLNAGFNGKIQTDFLLFEIDENVFPLALKEIRPDVIVMLNLFRDQLDRYGEVQAIAHKWKKTLESLPPKTTLVLNADDPQIAYIGKDLKNPVHYFGLEKNSFQLSNPDHASDSTYCPRCEEKLEYSKLSYSHLGLWHCPNCDLTRPDPSYSDLPKSQLSGTYNEYNLQAAFLTVTTIGLSLERTREAVKSFMPAFGRQEEIMLHGKKTKIILAKNPAGFNETLRTIKKLNGEHLFFILNDRIADGKDVSWIWDIDLEKYVEDFSSITISGERAYDIALRVKYAQNQKHNSFHVVADLDKALQHALKNTPSNKTLFILPTYTAMLDLRKIITGKKIL